MKGYLGTTPTVEALGKLNLEGNIIPRTWRQWLKRDSGKVNSVAIDILAELVYWYRPILDIDEATGYVKGWRKKFKADKLQKSYQQLADSLGHTKRQIADNSRWLQERDYISIEKRTINGMGNVVFMDINVGKLIEISFPKPVNSSLDDETYKGDPIERSRVVRQNVEHIQRIPTEITDKKDQYRTAFSEKNADSSFSSFSEEEGSKDNCTSTQPKESTTGHIPNSKDLESRVASSKKSNKAKPEKREKFDGSLGLSCDRDGWIKLPTPNDVASQYRDTVGVVNAQTLLWMKKWLADHYAEELSLTVEQDPFTELWFVSGLQFDECPWTDFLKADGPMSVKFMRDVLTSRVGGFAEIFNEQMNEFFWLAWEKFVSNAA